ncbi:MAG: hypothetical protein M1827_001530 [Pycnora praestabilis]|nr:MAG: hypothetical protein M1827_001530 [Pycnora praestabilis]
MPSSFPMTRALSILSFFALLGPIFVSANCQCGYSVNATSSPDHTIYTDLLESDFLHLQNITWDTDWVPQAYNVSAADARGPYGKLAELSNVIANPIKDNYSYTGDGTLGGDPGLQLYVRGGNPSSGLVPMAEIATKREDMFYGSYRVAMKLTSISGTCGAFFWFYNNTQEVDLEFLSSEFNSSSSPVNLVLQSAESLEKGFNAASTPTFDVYELPFQPDEGYHEYRFDWSPEKVSFYADGQWLKDMTTAVPIEAGAIHLSHWSNGDPTWSEGPPTSDAIMTISYLKAYFNSSDPARQKDYTTRCTDPSAVNATCEVPDQTTAPDTSGSNGNQTGNTFFFSKQVNETMNQTVYGPKKSDATIGKAQWSSLLAVPMLVVTLEVLRVFVFDL